VVVDLEDCSATVAIIRRPTQPGARAVSGNSEDVDNGNTRNPEQGLLKTHRVARKMKSPFMGPFFIRTEYDWVAPRLRQVRGDVVAVLPVSTQPGTVECRLFVVYVLVPVAAC